MYEINININNNKGKIEYFLREVQKLLRFEEGRDYIF